MLPALLSAQQATGAENWGPWRDLVGEWGGEGGGQPGQGTGGFSFSFELGGKILVRKNRADYPATKDRPAFSHEDWMVIYPEPAGAAACRAIYFDNEGHVIEYKADFSAAQGTFTFLSEAVSTAPRYRLTYKQEGKDRVSVKFEIAPPGKPDSFAIYLQAVAQRRSRGSSE